MTAEPWVWLALGGPWGAWLLALGTRAALGRRPRDPAVGSAAGLDAARLRLESDGRPGLAEAETALVHALRARFGAAVTSGSQAERLRALAAAGASPELAAAVEEAHRAIHNARFAGGRRAAPGPVEDATRGLARVAELLDAPDRAWPGSAPRAPLLLAPFALLAIAGASVLGAQPAGAPEFAPTAIEARGAWQAANDAYRTGDFASAARLYALILETWADPRLEANHAAALWRSGRPGAASAHYLHALALDPHATEVRSDAARLRAVLGDPPDARGAVARAVGRMTLGELLVVMLMLDALAFAVFLLARRRSRLRPVFAALVALLVFAAAVTAVHAWTFGRPVLAVTADRTAIQGAPVEPGDDVPPIAWLQAGSVVRVLERGETNWRVRAPGTPAGWVARDRIVPLSSSSP
jgi:hypothetical protein